MRYGLLLIYNFFKYLFIIDLHKKKLNKSIKKFFIFLLNKLYINSKSISQKNLEFNWLKKGIKR